MMCCRYFNPNLVTAFCS